MPYPLTLPRLKTVGESGDSSNSTEIGIEISTKHYIRDDRPYRN
ncbi:hypothetical protein [Microcoleus vaginatus]